MPDNVKPHADADLVEEALTAAPGATDMAFLDQAQVLAAAARLARAAASRPPPVLRNWLGLAGQWSRVALGMSDVSPDPGDRRFADEAFTRSALYRRWAQAYLAWNRSVHQLVDELDLDDKSRLRAHFVAGLLTEAAAPTNTLLGNPAALREAARTRGASLRDGFRHYLHDLRVNGGMPSTVDTRPFEVGQTLATTPGAVVWRSEVLELLQYEPLGKDVYQRPLLVVPPQINRYYVLDLAPDRSLVDAARAAGHQVFMVSWRNPGPAQRAWNLDTYVAAVVQALEVALRITGQADLNLLGVCAGGITSTAMAGHLAATGDRRLHSLTLLVTALDWDAPSTLGTLSSSAAIEASIRRSQTRGIVGGRELNATFAWLRPNDLVWNYWANNYLMGRNPPAFDILAWNADATNLPAGLHADFLRLSSGNLLARPGQLEVLGSKVDLAAVTADAYIVGGLTDHIIPWQGCYRSLDLLGGSAEFVLCGSGHVQTLVAPPDNPKARYFTGPGSGAVDRPTDAEAWKAAATEHRGSWWGHWLDWLGVRSGARVDPPATLGSAEHPAQDPAPGSYVRG
jgi:polyhydroxyalkanoate synthase